ncbi:cid13 [Symbiodinium natans]|uniref:Cid13 protein n=1 Tax=Symbiodinium natans TaxID=878477 RepID=A0A812NB13_9DINO|nr:cid13 [Symbiodinium natans]
MLLHVLQRRPSPVVPSLQDIAVANGTPALYLSGVDCRFCSDAEEITATLQEQQGDLGQNKESLAALLFEFFRFFSYEYEHGVIAIRSPSGITRDEEGRSFFIVENPFEPGKDVANIEVRLYTRLREEFRRAHALLAEGASLSSLCEMPPAPGLDPLAGPILPGVNAPLCPPAKGSGLWRMSESKRSWD